MGVPCQAMTSHNPIHETSSHQPHENWPDQRANVSPVLKIFDPAAPPLGSSSPSTPTTTPCSASPTSASSAPNSATYPSLNSTTAVSALKSVTRVPTPSYQARPSPWNATSTSNPTAPSPNTPAPPATTPRSSTTSINPSPSRADPPDLTSQPPPKRPAGNINPL